MGLISTFGYLASAVLFLFLAALLLTVWRGRKLGTYLLAGCIASALWGVLLAPVSETVTVGPAQLFLAEIVRIAAWITFLAVLVRQIGSSKSVRFTAHGVWILMLVAGIFTLRYGEIPGFGISLSEVLLYGGLVASLTGLSLVEQLYRNSPDEARWGLKPLVMGVGGMFAFDLFMYSQGALFGGLDAPAWIARGWANCLFAPLIAAAARRNPTWELRIFVSRQVVFYTTAFVAVGAYLLAVSLGGYLLIQIGGSWGAAIRLVFLVGAILVLAALMFSGTMRAKLRVFLNKHFFQNKYDYREEWLRLVATLSQFEDSSTRQAIIQAVAQIMRSPAGLLWIFESENRRYRLAAAYGTEDEAPDIAIDDPVIEFVRKDGWVIDLNEYTVDREVYGDLQLPEWLTANNQAWLLVPVRSGHGLLALILIYRAPGDPRLNYEDRDLLKTVGSHIAVHIAQEKSDSLLAEVRQFEAYNRLTAFLMHDLNNLVAQLSLIVKNAEKHKRNPEFVDDTIATISNSVDRMQSVLRQLKRQDASTRVRTMSILDMVDTAVRRCQDRAPVPTRECPAESTGDLMVKVDPDQLEMVLSHLIRNAQDATPESGSVHVVVAGGATEVNISVVDDGEGMSRAFLNDRLFKPFDSTKGVQGMGIGAYQAREFARKSGGDLTVESEPGKGTAVKLRLPLRRRTREGDVGQPA